MRIDKQQQWEFIMNAAATLETLPTIREEAVLMLRYCLDVVENPRPIPRPAAEVTSLQPRLVS